MPIKGKCFHKHILKLLRQGVVIFFINVVAKLGDMKTHRQIQFVKIPAL